jgi:mannitol-specific phosphotransferase system IIBC component
VKQKDYLPILAAVIVSAVLSLIISNSFITSSKNRQSEVEVVPALNSEFNRPSVDDPYLNKDAVNPTQIIRIGENNNTNPFVKAE